MRTVERSVQIQIDVAMPLLGRQVRNFSKSALAGVINQYVEPSQFCIHRLEKLSYRIHPTHVRGPPEDPSERLHFLHGAAHRFAGTPANRDRDSLAQQVLGDGAPDSARAARDNCDLPGECFHHKVTRPPSLPNPIYPLVTRGAERHSCRRLGSRRQSSRRRPPVAPRDAFSPGVVRQIAQGNCLRAGR